MTVDEMNALRAEVEKLKQENVKLKQGYSEMSEQARFYMAGYQKLAMQMPSHKAVDEAEIEKRAAALFDGNSPQFNITEAGQFVKDYPAVRDAMIERFQTSWTTGKYAKGVIKGN